MINDTLEYLYALHNRGIKLGLKNIESILKECKNPESSFRSIHIAGTNGKGSTASILAKLFQVNNKKVGLYTSPHLLRFNERIRINGKPISDKDIINFTNKYKSFIEKNSITFFEATTAMAFYYFSKNKVDIAIIETGLGGRLDSTNVIKPEHTIITEIDFDHTHLLGETVEEITAEKCGIIKEKTPNITINSQKKIKDVIKKFSKDNNTETVFLSKKDIKNINQKKNEMKFRFGNNEYKLPQSGSYQAQNAILAIDTYKTTNTNVSEKNIQVALDKWYWPGRMQIMKENFFYDVAHNTSAVRILTDDLKKIYGCKPIGLVVMKNDKIKNDTVKIFNNEFHSLTISSIDSKDILSKQEIDEMNALSRFDFNENLTNALSSLDQIKTKRPKVVFGSHYIAKEVFNYFDFSFDKGTI